MPSWQRAPGFFQPIDKMQIAQIHQGFTGRPDKRGMAKGLITRLKVVVADEAYMAALTAGMLRNLGVRTIIEVDDVSSASNLPRRNTRCGREVARAGGGNAKSPHKAGSKRGKRRPKPAAHQPWRAL